MSQQVSETQILKLRCRREGTHYGRRCTFEASTEQERIAHESHHIKRGPYPETTTCLLCITDIPKGERTEHLKTKHGIRPKGGCNKYYLDTEYLHSSLHLNLGEPRVLQSSDGE